MAAPMVIVVLAAFAAGCALGVLAMVPSWWRHAPRRRRACHPATAADAPATAARRRSAGFDTFAEACPQHPPRAEPEGL
jgi:lipopolysaccharide assembly protein A